MESDTTATTPWLSPDQQRAWRSILGGVTVLMDTLDRDLRSRHDLSLAEYEILVRLSEADGRTIRMAELAAALAHSRSRVTHTIARLERDGLVTRSAAGDDRRGVNAVMTEAGFDALSKAAHTHVRGVHDYLIAQTTDEELQTIGVTMQKVVETLGGRQF